MRELLLSAGLLLAFLGIVEAQEGMIRIGAITIQGNQKTKDEIILRELLFKSGDLVPDSLLEVQMERSKDLVMNTGLFNEATFNQSVGNEGEINLEIIVIETWYIYPVPVFELIDRNFNVWWVEQNRSLDRINFGIEFAHLNFTGQKDKLKLTAKYGYTRSYSLKYSFPYIDRAQTLGIVTEVAYARNRELNYNSIDNKQLFYKDTDGRFIFQRFWSEFGLIYRPGFHLTHGLRLRFQQNQVDDYIASELNPDFFLDGRKNQRFFSLRYHFTYDLRDVRSYPLEGNLFTAELIKDGLGFFSDRNALTLLTNYDHFWTLSDRWSTGFQFGVKLSMTRQQQPFNEYRAFGFGRNNLYGYEYYVVNGMDMALLKSFMRYRLFTKELNFGKFIPIKSFRKMPMKAYLSFNQGIAVVNDPYTSEVNPFSNRALWGGGLGLDIVLYYDKVFRIQYSYNHLFEHGLFLHFNTNI
ncbi:MAG: BamA/TamA family outer membrane protein [Saprospiraceae bacterium]|nr:BamA/TamA family outer membrane protein [Lewinella sp.]